MVDVDLSEQAKFLWGKTNRLDGDWWLPLYVHMADSIAMAERIWDYWVPDGTKRVIARGAGGADDAAAPDYVRAVYLLLAGAHDIGKATPIFQAKPIRFDPSDSGSPESLAWLPEHAGLPIRRDFADPNKPSHPIAGQAIFEWHMREAYGWGSGVTRSYASVIGGHHGTPSEDQKVKDARLGEPIRMGWDEKARDSWRPVQSELLEFVIRRAGLSKTDLEMLGAGRLSAESESLLTGLVVMADWMASNSDEGLFPLVPVPGTLAALSCADGGAGCDYDDVRSWEGLNVRAERAWRSLHLCTPWRPVSDALGVDPDRPDDVERWFRSRFKLPEGARPRPVQREAAKLAGTVEQPGLMIIEAPMGEGKTEAALAAAELLAQRTGRGGVCVALPTMATTDAMFGRVRAWLDALPAPEGEDDKTVWLAHGKAQLNEEFRGIIAASRRAMSSIDADADPVGSGTRRRTSKPETTVSEWMWGRKKGVLANFLVCTVDQVLMGALQMKHVVLRQLALANKVVVIDECHAYDAYMQEYLKRILEWLGGFRTPVVLLSATLPERQRREMAEAYLRGWSVGERQHRPAVLEESKADVNGLPIHPRRRRRRGTAAASPASVSREHGEETSAYPMITYSSGSKLHSESVAPSGRSLQVACRLLSDDDESLIGLLDALLDGGGCIGVICDTVGRAQHAANLLSERYGSDAVRLTHSRFVDMDRMDNERELRDLLGPHSTRANGRRPERLIVVGTQVLEQSLDIDFDALVTDIAPVDLLMQRLGRVHRHVRGDEQCDRPPRLREASCYIRGIEAWDDGAEPRYDGGVKTVYEEASLMETLGVMGLTSPSSTMIAHLPEDIAVFVRRAYGDRAIDAIPQSWRESYTAAVDHRSDEWEKKRLRAQSYRIKSLRGMDDNQDTLTDWFKNSPLDDADDDKGQRAVRDTQETVEVMLLRRCGETIRLLPWIGDPVHGIEPGAEVPTGSAPDDRLALLISQCSVRLPAKMSSYEKMDALIHDLEQGCGDETLLWSDSPWLSGRLALFLEESGDGSLHACVNGFDVRYSRVGGLNVAKAE
ncbi:CRISPR-associated helicase Cas3' [Bifidobacterium leontopitheci]|uniref:CRISPR-associated helicase/endonuclease Cas3 n=1 Tax=Bifidobacterium leontopitheci TaxID=2650774 RepID=A0A6I1GU25_9BIFI|nr:CRISPR-associated helicase Cas3' [Bifidobacterium leontopitheci]KAB7789971.1 CRISPR-associated helicase/endonuclease Cas3 [Bifidobacterium leontopitheci]